MKPDAAHVSVDGPRVLTRRWSLIPGDPDMNWEHHRREVTGSVLRLHDWLAGTQSKLHEWFAAGRRLNSHGPYHSRVEDLPPCCRREWPTRRPRETCRYIEKTAFADHPDPCVPSVTPGCTPAAISPRRVP